MAVDARTFKSHQLHDQAAAVRSASKRVIAAQEADVAHYISSATLADEVSGTPKQQGGRLWSKSDPDPQDLETFMQNLSMGSPGPSDDTTSLPIDPQKAPGSFRSEPPRRSRVDSHLQRLAGIEASVVKLANKTAKELTDVNSYAGDLSAPFPLEHLLLACTSLQKQLDEVNGRQAAVVETKWSIVEQLDDVRGLLGKGKRDWKQKQTEHSDAAASAAGNELKTGELPSLLLYILS
jgi:hypothetical protein